MDQGIAFCPECRAPQIRVILPEPVIDLPSEPERLEEPVGFSVIPAIADPRSAKINWSIGRKTSVIAGSTAALLMMLPPGALGLGPLTAGFLAVVLYLRRNLGSIVSPWMGMCLGMVSGVIGFVIYTILIALAAVVFGIGRFRAAMIEALTNTAARSPDPQVQQIFESFKTPSGLAMFLVVGLAFLFVISLVFSGLAGAIAAALFRRRSRS